MSPLVIWLFVAAVCFGLIAIPLGVYIALGLALALIFATNIQPPAAS